MSKTQLPYFLLFLLFASLAAANIVSENGVEYSSRYSSQANAHLYFVLEKINSQDDWNKWKKFKIRIST